MCSTGVLQFSWIFGCGLAQGSYDGPSTECALCSCVPRQPVELGEMSRLRTSMVVLGSHKRWGWVAFLIPPIGSTTYIRLIVLAFLGGQKCYLSHLLWEPETTFFEGFPCELP